MSIEELKEISDVLEPDAHDAISFLKTCVEKRLTNRCTEQDSHGAGNRSI